MNGPASPLVRSLRRTLVAAGLAVGAVAVGAATQPYDETANATADVERALAAAATTRKPVLLVFGANWCQDCRALDAALKAPKNAELVAKEFLVVKVDVGNFNRNLELNAQFGNPIKGGIPAAVVVAPTRKVLYATRGGELADARRMSETGVYDFFRKAASSANARP